MGCGASTEEEITNAGIEVDLLRDANTNAITQKVLLLGAGILKR